MNTSPAPTAQRDNEHSANHPLLLGCLSAAAALEIDPFFLILKNFSVTYAFTLKHEPISQQVLL